jgi:hypothetical protein
VEELALAIRYLQPIYRRKSGLIQEIKSRVLLIKEM